MEKEEDGTSVRQRGATGGGKGENFRDTELSGVRDLEEVIACEGEGELRGVDCKIDEVLSSLARARFIGFLSRPSKSRDRFVFSPAGLKTRQISSWNRSSRLFGRKRVEGKLFRACAAKRGVSTDGNKLGLKIDQV